jgi:hypothetical protein
MMWTLDELRVCITDAKLVWRKHALERMLERGITRAEVNEVLRIGEIIEQYEDDRPFASALLCVVRDLPLHVVVALDRTTRDIYVITVYRPDLTHFTPDYKTRIK